MNRLFSLMVCIVFHPEYYISYHSSPASWVAAVKLLVRLVQEEARLCALVFPSAEQFQALQQVCVCRAGDLRMEHTLHELLGRLHNLAQNITKQIKPERDCVSHSNLW